MRKHQTFRNDERPVFSQSFAGLATVFLLYLLRLAATLLTGLIGRFLTPSPNICDRTEHVQQAILEQLPGVNSFKKVTTAHLESVTLGFERAINHRIARPQTSKGSPISPS